jgi:hypothetical protein
MNWRDRATSILGNTPTPALTKPTKPPSVSFVSSSPATNPEKPARIQKAEAWDYELSDLQEMDRLLRELADLEGWTVEELADLLDERRRMAPANVRSMLEAVRTAHALALAPWPEAPKERSDIVLCPLTTKRRLAVLQGGKSSPVDQPKRQSGGRGRA